MISLIHPSRGRPQKSFDNAIEWIAKAGCEVELIVSIDTTDDCAGLYVGMYKSVKVLIKDNKSVVEATNHAAKEASGDILIYLSDDFKCPDNWAVSVENEFKKYVGPTLLKVYDKLQAFNIPVLTIPIMNRALYERLGYFFHPDYKSMFVDEHLYWVCKKLHALKMAPHLEFPHEHVSIGKAKDDDTYRNSAKNWSQGQALFAKHKAEGFQV
jgi:hypothetical protein